MSSCQTEMILYRCGSQLLFAGAPTWNGLADAWHSYSHLSIFLTTFSLLFFSIFVLSPLLGILSFFCVFLFSYLCPFCLLFSDSSPPLHSLVAPIPLPISLFTRRLHAAGMGEGGFISTTQGRVERNRGIMLPIFSPISEGEPHEPSPGNSAGCPFI